MSDFQRVVSTGVAWARQVEAEERIVCTYGVVTAYPADWVIQQIIGGESQTFVMNDIDFKDDWVIPSAAVRADGTSAGGTDPHPLVEPAPEPVPDPNPPVEPSTDPVPPAEPVPAPDAAPDVVNTAPADAVPVPDAGKHEAPDAALVAATTPVDDSIPAKVKEIPTTA